MIKFRLIIYNFNLPLFRIALKGKFKHTHTHTHKELRERSTIKERKKLHLLVRSVSLLLLEQGFPQFHFHGHPPII